VSPKPSSMTPPSRISWPPLLIGATLVVGLAIDLFLRLPEAPAPVTVVGGLFIAAALWNDALCAREFKHRETTLMPNRAATALVMEGPYRLSRNPIYIAHVVMTLGIGLVLGSWSIVALTPLLALGLHYLCVLPEERHLRERFGRSYDQYAEETPRWFRWGEERSTV
jgi:protein-S-isoprenylcysteine O-methyltransferase Ste14